MTTQRDKNASFFSLNQNEPIRSKTWKLSGRFPKFLRVCPKPKKTTNIGLQWQPTVTVMHSAMERMIFKV